VVVSVVQEVRAKRILDKIALLARPKATLVRNGTERAAAIEELVVGDVLRVGPGDQVVLDGSVVEGKMQVDESQLTGESDQIAKDVGSLVYSGSFCVSGSAYYVVEKVGAASLANQITRGARAYRRVLTPLQRQINFIIRAILFTVIYLELLIFTNGLLKAISLPEGVQQATVIAGLVPNGLFVAIAVAYALGAVRIAGQGALVQQANAVESLSSVNVLCLDKTGTLTTNRLKFEQLHPLGMNEAKLRTGLGVMMASSGARNKTADAIAAALPAQPVTALAEVSFSSARKWSALAFTEPEIRGIWALGAPEMLRVYLGRDDAADSALWQSITTQGQEWANRGLRVLLVAYHPDPTALQDAGDASRLPEDMQGAGLVALSDELRPEAADALATFIRSGVSPKIISGDNPETVAALARQAGLPSDARLFSGLELKEMTSEQFAAAAAAGMVFGRITPQQKEQLVEALRGSGHYVAMIGDGVNDVLSLKKANLGVAMQSGTQATRNVADIILTDDSFAALVPAVAEGQRIVNGLQDVLKLFMARIATMIAVILSALIVGVFPINLRHGTVLTFFIVGIPALVLAAWAQGGAPPQKSLARRLAHFVIPAAFLSSLLGLLVFYGPMLFSLTPLAQNLGEQLEAAIQQSILTGQTSLTAFLGIVGVLLVLFAKPPTHWWKGGSPYSGDRRVMLLAAALGAGFIAVMLLPVTQVFFDLAPLGWLNWALIVVTAAIWLFSIRWVWRSRFLERFFGLDD
jgi:cation-transporting ATPase E